MVKCADCGFLSLRRQDIVAFEETPNETRKEGRVPILGQNRGYQAIPLCFVQAFPLGQEILQERPTFEDDSRAFILYSMGSVPDEEEREKARATLLAVITRERVCPVAAYRAGFIKWQQGFTPKEHREMLDRDRMLQWQREESRQNRKYRLIELGLVLATVVVVIVAAFIERGGQPTIINNLVLPTPPAVQPQQ